MQVEYAVVEAGDLGELQKLVNRALASGWQCQGGLAVYLSPDGGTRFYYQALVR